MNSKSFYRRYRNRRLNHDKRLFYAYRRAIGTIYDMVLAGVSRGKQAIPSTKTMVGIFQNATRGAYAGIAADGILTGLQDAEEFFGKPLPVLLEKAVTREDVEALGMGNTVTAIQAEAMNKIIIQDIAPSIKSSLAKTFEMSAKANESVQELAARIQEKAKLDKLWKARRIAQTETTRAFNKGTLDGYLKSTVVGKKEWVTNMFGKPRKTHAAANGQQVSADKPFVVGGEEMMCPGDSAGSAENVVNCMCGMMPVIGDIKPTVQPEKPTWEPSMSLSDADRWAANSVYKETIYHGTTKHNSASIIKYGFSKKYTGATTNNGGFLGTGNYFSKHSNVAASYGDTRLKIKINTKNPLNWDTPAALEIRNKIKYPHDYFEAGALRDYTKSQLLTKEIINAGYDSIIFKNGYEIVVFNKRNIVVIK